MVDSSQYTDRHSFLQAARKLARTAARPYILLAEKWLGGQSRVMTSEPNETTLGDPDSALDDLLDRTLEPAPAAEQTENAKEMLLGKVQITDGTHVSHCEWNVVGAGQKWAFSAIMQLKNGTNHRIVMGYDKDGCFLHKGQASSKEEALAAAKTRIQAFLKRQPRWRVIA